MAMVGLVGAGMEVEDGTHMGQSHRWRWWMARIRDKAMDGGWSHVGSCRGIYRVRGNTLISLDHTAVQVRAYGKGGDGICRSSWKGLNTGRHKANKALVRCLCSRLVTLHGASWTQSKCSRAMTYLLTAVCSHKLS